MSYVAVDVDRYNINFVLHRFDALYLKLMFRWSREIDIIFSIHDKPNNWRKRATGILNGRNSIRCAAKCELKFTNKIAQTANGWLNIGEICDILTCAIFYVISNNEMRIIGNRLDLPETALHITDILRQGDYFSSRYVDKYYIYYRYTRYRMLQEN